MERVGDEDLPALMRHAAVFVYPAFAEGFGMPVAEAIASAVPVITSNTTSLPEVAGLAALAVNPHDVQALSAALTELLGKPDVAERLVAAGPDQLRPFDWERSAQVLLRVVRSKFQA